MQHPRHRRLPQAAGGGQRARRSCQHHATQGVAHAAQMVVLVTAAVAVCLSFTCCCCCSPLTSPTPLPNNFSPTLHRDEAGKVVAMDDTCPHRGAPLSDGWTATDKDTGKK
jgi:hypothetical protein